MTSPSPAIQAEAERICPVAKNLYAVLYRALLLPDVASALQAKQDEIDRLRARWEDFNHLAQPYLGLARLRLSEHPKQFDPKCAKLHLDRLAGIWDGFLPTIPAAINPLAPRVGEIDARDARIKVLEAALRPFVKRAEYFDRVKPAAGGDWRYDHHYADDDPSEIYIGHLRDARTALNPPASTGEQKDKAE